MLEVWRIVKTKHATTAFSGEGARRHGGRWNSPGRLATYASGTIALATLEVLVGLDNSAPLDAYVVMSARVDDQSVAVISSDDLPMDWDQLPPGQETQRMGDTWLDGLETLVLSVPSVVVPYERNYVLNPLHPSFQGVEFGSPLPIEFDPRLTP